MDTIDTIRALQTSLEKNGNLPVIVYSPFAKFEVAEVAPCSQKDHVLVVLGGLADE